MPADTKPKIVLIHGLWMTPRSWEKWKQRYEQKGYEVIAPAWPGMEVEVEALNADPSPVADLDIEEIVDNYEKIIRGLDSPPIIMGHSFGGAFTQLLLSRGVPAVSAIGVASGTVKGVPDLPLSTLKVTAPVLRNPFRHHRAVPLDEKQFRYGFCNTMSEQESSEVYKRYHVPAAANVLFEAAMGNLHRHPVTEVDFEKDDRAPLLFIAFEDDHIVPPKATRHNAEKYKSKAVTAYTEFAGRPHFPAAPGWEEVADFALAWALTPTTIGIKEAVTS